MKVKLSRLMISQETPADPIALRQDNQWQRLITITG